MSFEARPAVNATNFPKAMRLCILSLEVERLSVDLLYRSSSWIHLLGILNECHLYCVAHHFYVYSLLGSGLLPLVMILIF